VSSRTPHKLWKNSVEPTSEPKTEVGFRHACDSSAMTPPRATFAFLLGSFAALACQSTPGAAVRTHEAAAEPRPSLERERAEMGWVRIPIDLEAQEERDLRRLGCVLPSETTFRRWADLRELKKHCGEVLAIGAATLVGRAVDALGEPLRHAELAPECENVVHSSGTTSCVHVAWPLLTTVRSDEDGRFQLDFERVSMRQLESVQLVASRLGKVSQRGPAAVVLRSAAGCVGGLLIDLGDVQLTAPPVAYVGRVQNAAGEPVVGARVALSRVGSDGDRSEVAHNWTDDAGRAEFPAPPGLGSLCMSAHHFAHVDARVIYVLSDYGPPMSALVPVSTNDAETVVILER